MAWNRSWATALLISPAPARFVALMLQLLLPFDLLLHDSRGQRTGIHVVDSTKLVVRHNPRIRWNKLFQGLALNRGPRHHGGAAVQGAIWMDDRHTSRPGLR